MLRVDLIRLEEEKYQMKFAAEKLNQLTEEFDSTMRAVEQMLNIEELEQKRYGVHRRLEEHQDGIRQLGNAAVRARQLYQHRERQITENCEEGNIIIARPVPIFRPFSPSPPLQQPEWLERVFGNLRLENVFGEED